MHKPYNLGSKRKTNIVWKWAGQNNYIPKHKKCAMHYFKWIN